MSSFKQSLPNILTVSRILMIPLLIYGILAVASGQSGFFGRPSVVISLYLILAFTDYLDGYLARKWDVTSDFGRMLDPIADKLFVAGCLFAISVASHANPLITVPALLIIGRDILVSGAREFAALKGRAMPPTQLAKWKTAFEMLAIFILILWLSAQGLLPVSQSLPNFVQYSYYAGVICLWIAAILSVYTGALYFRAALQTEPPKAGS